MRRFVLALAMGAATAAAAQDATDPAVTTCGAFVAMDDAARVNLLSRLAIGDEIDTTDYSAAVGFAGNVAAACRRTPDRRVAEVATEAFGGN